MLFTGAFLVMGLAGSLPVLLAGAMLYGLGEGICIPTLQDVVTRCGPLAAGAARWWRCGSAPPAPRQTVGPLAAGAVYGATSTGATFVFGSGLAGAILVGQLVGRFGTDPDRLNHSRTGELWTVAVGNAPRFAWGGAVASGGWPCCR